MFLVVKRKILERLPSKSCLLFQLFDARSARTAREIFDAICEHLEYATNGGNIR